MVKKINKHKHKIAVVVGLPLLTFAATITALVAHEPQAVKIIKGNYTQDGNSYHRHEESNPNYISYNNALRTPARTANF